MVSVIAVYGEGNRVIGKDGKLPNWNLKRDMDRFVSLTTGKRLIVGKATFHPLRNVLTRRGRIPIVLTRNPDFVHPHAITVHSIEDAFEYCLDEEGIVVGGEQIYHLVLKHPEHVRCLYITIVHGSFTGDRFFPEIDMEQWKTVDLKRYNADKENSHPFTLLTLEKM